MKFKYYSILIFLITLASNAYGSESIKEAQRLLNNLGLNAGPADGVWGKNTESAITKFYARESLTFDGKIDQNELTDLRAAVAETGSVYNRFYVDQPDQSDDYKIHFNYVVFKDGQDRKRDLNGEIEKLVISANKKFLQATSKNQFSKGKGKKFKLDYTKDGKLDVTFISLDVSIKDLDDNFNLFLADILTQRSMNDPKKIYFNFIEAKGQQGGSGGVTIGHINLQHRSVKKRPEFMMLHELVHTQGMGFKCNKGVFKEYQNNHVTTQNHLIGEYTAAINFNGHIYDSQDKECPSLKDSVYLTPTADDPYDPYQLICLRKIGKYKHPVIEKLMTKQNYTKSYYKNRFATSCQWKKHLPDIFGD